MIEQNLSESSRARVRALNSQLTPRSFKSFLQSLIAFLKLTRHKGLILLLDELETVLAQSTSVRNAAYENIRLLMNNAEQAEHLHLFF